jgi:hypothetical protein
MYCPRCASRIVSFGPTARCQKTNAPLSTRLHADLLAFCVARTSLEQPGPLSFKVGGTWFCPGCGAPMREDNGYLLCDYCGAYLNRFVHSLVEFFVHPVVLLSQPIAPNPLLTTAMFGDTEVARAICARRPDLRATTGESGHTPAELAFAAGHVTTAVALARCGSVTGPLFPSPARLLVDFMRELSESASCAAWLDDLEYVLWSGVTRHKVLPQTLDPFGVSSLPRAVAEDLAWLSERASGWIHNGERGPEWVTLDAWHTLHASWEASHQL